MQLTEYKKLFKGKSTKFIQQRLDVVLEEIKFLEGIYMIGGNRYDMASKELRDCALKDRQEKCQLSSALYSILRDNKITTA